MISYSYPYKSLLLALLVPFGAMAGFMLHHNLMRHSGPKLTLFTPSGGHNDTVDTVEQIIAQGSSIADTLKEQLTEEHDLLVGQLYTAYPMQEWQAMAHKFEQCKAQDNLLANNAMINHAADGHALVRLARELLVEYGIDPNRVTVYTINEPASLTNAAAEQAYFKNAVLHRISINVPRLEKRSQEVQEAILRHEIQHLLNYDPLQLLFIDEVLEKSGVSQKEYIKNPAYMALNKHKEFRADLSAGCESIETAQAFQKNFEYNSAQNPGLQDEQAYWVTHPSNKQRHAAMNQVLGYLNAESQLTLA